MKKWKMSAADPFTKPKPTAMRYWTCAVSNCSIRSNPATRNRVARQCQPLDCQGLPATRCTEEAFFARARCRQPGRSSLSAQVPLNLSADHFRKAFSHSHLRILSPKEFPNLSAQERPSELDGRQECLPHISGNHIQHRLTRDDQRAVVAVDDFGFGVDAE